MAKGRTPRASLPKPGDVIAEKYRVESVIGRGGMGVVMAAHHLQLKQSVALKVLLPELLETPDVVARFLREGQAVARLKSEHVARVSDVGQIEGGSPYLVMELLEGVDLHELLRMKGALPIGAAVGYVAQACEALDEAHALGIVHRDLKPANLFITRRADGSPLVKVLDFGIAKQLGAIGETTLTLTEDVLGSPHYMSPEQIKDARGVDARSDLWALGAVLYRLLSGGYPFGGGSPSSVLANILGEPPFPLRSQRPEIPLELEAIVLRCLEKRPIQRFQSASELAAALAPFARSADELAGDEPETSLGARASSRHEAAPTGEATAIDGALGPTFVDTRSSGSPPSPSVGRRRLAFAAAIFLGAALASVVAFTLRARSHEGAPRAVTASTALPSLPAPPPEPSDERVLAPVAPLAAPTEPVSVAPPVVEKPKPPEPQRAAAKGRGRAVDPLDDRL